MLKNVMYCEYHKQWIKLVTKNSVTNMDYEIVNSQKNLFGYTKHIEHKMNQLETSEIHDLKGTGIFAFRGGSWFRAEEAHQ